MSETSRQDTGSDSVSAYFTNRDHICRAFRRTVDSERLARRIVVLHGVGGVGKSSLVRMFRIICQESRIPNAIATGDAHHSEVSIIEAWAEQLASQRIELPSFASMLKRFRDIESRIRLEAARTKPPSPGAAHAIVTRTAKLTVKAGASFVPVFGPVLDVLGDVGIDVASDWLMGRGFKYAEIEFAREPASALTNAFLDDIARIAGQRRIVLMLDTCEKVAALDRWIASIAEGIHRNIVLVLAGRDMGRLLSDSTAAKWIADAEVVPVEPLTREQMVELAARYYETQVGRRPDMMQIASVVEFAHGLPLAVTAAVKTWIMYPNATSFGEVRGEAAAEVVKRLREGVPADVAEVLEAASVVRYFNKSILRHVSGHSDIEASYAVIKDLPFVRSGWVGSNSVWRIHDSVRWFMDQQIRTDDPDRHKELHQRAVAYFESHTEDAEPEEADRVALERLYHLVAANEKRGMQAVQEYAEQLVRLEAMHALRTIVNEMAIYPLARPASSLWREYYGVRIDHLEWRSSGLLERYERLFNDPNADAKLKAYALCDWAQAAMAQRFRYLPSILERALEATVASLNSDVEVDQKLAANYEWQADLYYLGQDDWDRSLSAIEDAKAFFRQRNDRIGLSVIERHVQSLAAVRGDWPRYILARELALKHLGDTDARSSLSASVNVNWIPALAWAGRCYEAECNAKRGIEAMRRTGWSNLSGALRDLGLILTLQDRFVDANVAFHECEQFHDTLSSPQSERTTLYRWRLNALLREGKVAEARAAANSLEMIYSEARYESAMAELYALAGLAAELDLREQEALDYYWKGINARFRVYHINRSRVGYVRIRAKQGNLDDIVEIMVNLEQWAIPYQHRDHMATLRIIQAQLAWDSTLDTWGTGEDTAFDLYREGLMLALQHNRFTLDELMFGRAHRSPNVPIVEQCMNRGSSGTRMIERIAEWWSMGMNQPTLGDAPTISPLPLDVPLIDAERIAREREPGDGSTQIPVLDRLVAAM